MESGEDTYWIPVAIQHAPPFNRYLRVAILNDNRTAIARIDPKRQRELTTFVNQWARNIRDQGWLDDGIPRNILE